MPDKQLVLLAGAGQLPLEIYHHECAQGRAPVVIVGDGVTVHPVLAQKAIARLPLGQVTQMIKVIKSAGGTDVLMVGKVDRQSLSTYQPDEQLYSAVAAIGGDTSGDDGMLRAWSGCFVNAGLRLCGIQDVLPDAIMPAGVLTHKHPHVSQTPSLERAFAVAHALGSVDVGQAVVVQDGLVLGVEALEGTDKLITRCATLLTASTIPPVLVKAAKPQQDLRLDLPALGPTTIGLLATHGYAGIALEAHKSLLIAREKSLACANRHNLFIMGMTVQ